MAATPTRPAVKYFIKEEDTGRCAVEVAKGECELRFIGGWVGDSELG